MPGRIAVWLGMVLGAFLGLALMVPAAAQVPIPYAYDEQPGGDLKPAPRDKPAARVATEQAAADSAETACDTGDLAGCAALGRAFMLGEGRPQNRPVAELLLRQACDGAEAAGCLALGQLFRSTTEPEVLAAGTLALGRACRLGNPDACAAEAEAVDKGNNRADGNRMAANALRRTACDRGSTAACLALGSDLAGSDDPASRAEGLRLLERLCRAGEGQACGRMAGPLQRENPPRNALAQEMIALGCRAGTPYLCNDLGALLFRQASGPPETRTEALAAFDRACALSDVFCGTAATIRAHPALVQGCESGAQADCLALGRLYASETSLFHAPAEAVRLLGGACEAGEAAACHPAAEAREPSSPDQIAQAMRWLDLGCTGGVDADCETLGKGLLTGEYFAPDKPRGYALLGLACERGGIEACDMFDRYAMDDPDAPLLPADARFGPPLSAEEEAEFIRRRKSRNYVVAGTLLFFVILFYAITMVRMGD